MKLKKIILLLLIALFSFSVFGDEDNDIIEIAKDYPYKDSPLMATVFGTT